jgi:hypothetical protein
VYCRPPTCYPPPPAPRKRPQPHAQVQLLEKAKKKNKKNKLTVLREIGGRDWIVTVDYLKGRQSATQSGGGCVPSQ